MEPEELLRELDFNEYEIKIYLALVKLKSATASELAKSSKVPRNKVYEIVEGLKSKGFLMELSGKPMRFKILSFERLKDMINERRKELDRLEKQADKVMADLENIPGETFQDMVWVIRGQKAIMEKMILETKKTGKEYLSCSRSSIDVAKGFKSKQEAIRNGAKVKVIGALNKNNMHIVKKWMKIGVEYRVYNEKKFGPYGVRFGVFDDRACRLTIGKPDVQRAEDYVTIWSESPSLINMFRRQFYQMWEECEPAEEALKKM